MKKDIEWLRHKLERLGGIDNHMRNQCEPSSGDQLYYDGSLAATERALDFIDELDSQEVLSQEKNINIVLHDLKEHIKEQQSLSQNIGLAHTSAGNNTHYRQYDYVLECIDEYEPSDELQNLLVPKREVTETQAWEVLGEKYKITWIELRDNVDKLIEFLNKGYTLDKIENNESTQAEVKRFMDTIASEGIFKIGNKEYVVNEKPIIPKYVGEFIEELKASGDGMDDAFSILRGFYHQSKTADWVAKENRNSETFARVWLDGYTVEEEQKYNVKIKPRSSAGTVGVFLYKRGDGVLAGDNFKGYYPEKDKFRLTEQEIKDYDERYWAFAVKVEEVE